MATDNNCTSPPTPRGSRYWRRPTPVVTRSISSRNNAMATCPMILVSCRKRRARISWISQLGDDLLVEILIRSFPDPKSASCCKAVCKRWSSLISSPCFNRRFINMNLLLHQPASPMPYSANELVSVILSFLPPMPMPERYSDVDPTLHPYNPGIVLFKCFDCGSHLYSCDLAREGEVKLLGKLEKVDPNHYDFYAKVIEPRFSCWPTPIPTYKELPEHKRWI